MQLTDLILDAVAGEVRDVSIPFVSDLASGETLVSVAAQMQPWYLSPVVDANAANLVLASAHAKQAEMRQRFEDELKARTPETPAH